MTEDIKKIFEYWQQIRNHPSAKLTPGRKSKIKARLTEGYTIEDILMAIDGLNKSPHHCGKNETGTVYDDITLICRSGEKLEQFKAVEERARAARKTISSAPAAPGKPVKSIEDIHQQMEEQLAQEAEERRKGLRY